LLCSLGALLFTLALFTPRAFAGDVNEAFCPNEHLVGYEASLPDCRAYEMVTPPYKEGGFKLVGAQADQDGQQLRLETFGSLLSSEGTLPQGIGGLGHVYHLVRTVTGWTPVAVDAPFARFPIIEVLSFSPDFDSSIWYVNPPNQTSSDVYLDSPAGLTSVGPGAPPGSLETALTFIGASEGLDHTLFVVHSANVGLEEEHLWPGDTTLGERRPSLYEYAGTNNAEPSLVGVSDARRLAHIDESHLISNCGTVLGSGAPENDAYNAVSADGTTVFFTSKACGGGPPVDEVYARIDRENTVAVSEPPLSVPGRECDSTLCVNAESVPGNRKAGVFAGASLDGSHVVFLTSQPLVNADTDGGVDLYAERIEGGMVTRLTQLSGGGMGDATPGSGADVLGVARVSEDGSHVYFVAQGALTGANKEGRAPLTGEPNLYVSVEECPGGGDACANPTDRTSFIGTLSSADAADWSAQDDRPVQVTPDGRFLVFQSTADLTPDQEGRIEAGQVFEYDAQTETLTRVSHGQEGYDEDGNSSVYPATIPSQINRVAEPATRFANLAMSADGSRVFFSSADALTPRALAGYINIYEYHDGEITLITDGHTVTTIEHEVASELIGTDESGRDVFFTTPDELTSQDGDTWVDVYDARIDGGFRESVVPAPCAGDACYGPASPAPSLLSPGVPTGAPEANISPVAPQKAVKVAGRKPEKHKKPKKKVKQKTKRKAAHGGKKRGHRAAVGRRDV
jgi:hypothetical protein